MNAWTRTMMNPCGRAYWSWTSGCNRPDAEATRDAAYDKLSSDSYIEYRRTRQRVIKNDLQKGFILLIWSTNDELHGYRSSSWFLPLHSHVYLGCLPGSKIPEEGISSAASLRVELGSRDTLGRTASSLFTACKLFVRRHLYVKEHLYQVFSVVPGKKTTPLVFSRSA